ncbi:MAG TPA: hypothetical protein VEK38_00645 [Candidatus Bathyarchaeia archaeon]|nr:hypothetical protein [Candidatus Bathyarchaeia archaeon]
MQNIVRIMVGIVGVMSGCIMAMKKPDAFMHKVISGRVEKQKITKVKKLCNNTFPPQNNSQFIKISKSIEKQDSRRSRTRGWFGDTVYPNPSLHDQFLRTRYEDKKRLRDTLRAKVEKYKKKYDGKEKISLDTIAENCEKIKKISLVAADEELA